MCHSSFSVPHCYLHHAALLNWIGKRKIRINLLHIVLPYRNLSLNKELLVDSFQLFIHAYISNKDCNLLQDQTIGHKIYFIDVMKNQRMEILEQLGNYTPNITSLQLTSVTNSEHWLTKKLLNCWKLNKIRLRHVSISISILIFENCPELRSIMLYDQSDDTVIATIAKNCTKLQDLTIHVTNRLTYTSLLILSEHSLPLKSITITDYIPNFPNSEIAKNCTHILSCIHSLNTKDNLSNTSIEEGNHEFLLSRLINLKSITFTSVKDCLYIPTLIKHCRNIESIRIKEESTVNLIDLSSLCRMNMRISSIDVDNQRRLDDTGLNSILQFCPHLKELNLKYETDITDICILALSEYCLELQDLDISKCKRVTETAVLQLVEHCTQLRFLTVSYQSLSDWHSHQLRYKYKTKLYITRLL